MLPRFGQFRPGPHHTDRALLRGCEHIIQSVVVLRVAFAGFDGKGATDQRPIRSVDCQQRSVCSTESAVNVAYRPLPMTGSDRGGVDARYYPREIIDRDLR